MAYPDMAYSDAEAARQAGGQTSRQTARRIVGRAVQHKAVRTRKTTEARTAVGAWIRTVRSTVKGTVKAALIGAIALALLTGGSAVAGVFAQSDDAAQSNLADITLVRTVDDDGLVLAQPVGLAGSPDALYLVESTPAAGTLAVIKLTPFGDRLDSVTIPVPADQVAAVAFDSRFNRLLMLDAANGELLALAHGPDGRLDPASLARLPVAPFGVQQAAAMSVDAATGRLYFLVNASSQGAPQRTARIVALDPAADGSLAAAAPSVVDLTAAPVRDGRGLALDPASGHLHVADAATQRLYEVTAAGELVAVRDLGQFNPARSSLPGLRGMVLAPSADLTDDPARLHLYLLHRAARSQILEFSLSGAERAQAAAVLTYQASVIHTVRTYEWNPPSPDPSGITFLPHKNRLLISDGEVDETVVIMDSNGVTQSVSLYQGVNMWQMGLGGVDGTWTTLPDPAAGTYSDEPTGVTINPSNNHLFITDDAGARSVYEVDPGPDGNYGTGDDVVTSFSTGTHNNSRGFGSLDPEGITYAPGLDVLFIIDGTNREVYRVAPGPDGRFNGVPPEGDDTVTHFDVEAIGVSDPEGIVYNHNTGTLYIAGEAKRSLFETTTTGELIRVIDVTGANGKHLAGLAYAPSSLDPDLMSLYVVDRYVDNNFLPDRYPNDGRVYEITLPQIPLAGDDSATTPQDTAKIIDVAANDSDPDDNLDPTSTNTNCNGCSTPSHGTLTNHGDGTFTYAPNAGYTGSDSFVYQICDGDALCAQATVSITVSGTNAAPAAVNDSVSTPQDTAKLINVAANDSDPDGNLDPTSTNTNCNGCSTPDHGSLTNHGDGTFTYTPDADYTGSDSFVYQICDSNGLCDTATVDITVNGVNAAPEAKDDGATTSQGRPVRVDVAANDSDPDDNLNPASVTAGCGACARPEHGSLTNHGDGSFTYTPDDGFLGSDSFVYRICDDGGLCDTATVTIEVTVRTTNTAPDAVDDSAMTKQGQPVTIDVAANDTDPEGNLLPETATTGCGDCVPPEHGKVSDNGDGTITYSPDSGFSGTDQFVYEICDSGTLCDNATVTVEVRGTAVGGGPVKLHLPIVTSQ